MLRILSFFLVVLAAGLGFTWLVDNPGTVSVVWLGQAVRMNFTVFVILEAVFAVAVVFLVWLVAALFKAPHRVGGRLTRRRRERGYRALTSGIIAAGAGDAVLARRLAKRSEAHLSRREEPLLRFLDAQTAMIEGDHARARAAFETMEKDPETRLLGLRGLFLEAERLGDVAAARHYAERAVRIAPHVPWAGGAVLELKAAENDFDGALEILEAQRDSHLVERAESHRLRAVLLTGKALALADTDPAASRTAAREAQKLAPDLTPAAATAARALIRLAEPRKAGRVLEAAWKAAPHPEIAALYLHLRPEDGAQDRLKRARQLKGLQPDHVESNVALAHAALDAEEYALARHEARLAVDKAPRESIFLLLADIEDADGNEGKVREWMSRALRAPKDPAWVADSVVLPDWKPVSPVTGRLDAFRWETPPGAREPASGPAIEAASPLDAAVGSYPRSAGAVDARRGEPIGYGLGASDAVTSAGDALVVGAPRSGDASEPARAL